MDGQAPLAIVVRDAERRLRPTAAGRRLHESHIRGLACAFNRKQTRLRPDAAGRGETADSAAGGKHAMARDDEREGIPPKRLPHGARRTGRAKPRCDVAVGECRTRRNRARELVDTAVKRRHAIHIEYDA